MKQRKILIKFPTRERKKKYILSRMSIIENLSGKNETFLLITCDEDDLDMSFLKAKPSGQIEDINLKYDTIFGESKNKIHAINRDLENYQDWDILVLMSDDFKFVKKGWDEIVVNVFNKIDDNGNKPYILHFPDGGSHGERIITMPIMNKAFYELQGNIIYRKEFKSLYCDDFQTIFAKKNNAYFRTDEIIAIHYHPIYTGEQFDRLLNHTQSFAEQDKKTFEELIIKENL